MMNRKKRDKPNQMIKKSMFILWFNPEIRNKVRNNKEEARQTN